MKNYAARLDRIYVSKLFSSIEDNFTYPISFSDHLCVCVTLNIAAQVQISRPRWRLNVSLLKTNIIKENLHILWSYLQRRKLRFPNLIHWWEELVKPQIKTFYIQEGREQKKLEKGLLNYYEINLRALYDKANNDNILEYAYV